MNKAIFKSTKFEGYYTTEDVAKENGTTDSVCVAVYGLDKFPKVDWKVGKNGKAYTVADCDKLVSKKTGKTYYKVNKLA